MKEYSSEEISNIIYDKLLANKDNIITSYEDTNEEIGYFYLDHLLPSELAKRCFESFPDKSEMKCLKTIREYKYISAQMDKHHKLLESVLYAFQDPKIVQLIGEICGMNSLYADESLYAGGLSLMGYKNYLNPHLDNSQDANRNRWRVLNLLYYVTPSWERKNGGHLELWPSGVKNKPITIESKFNRLVVMATHSRSWHSVSPVKVNLDRCCISNYYFSNEWLNNSNSFHVTRYKGWPDQKFKRLILDVDYNLRMLIRRLFKKGIRKNPHIYKKNTK